MSSNLTFRQHLYAEFDLVCSNILVVSYSASNLKGNGTAEEHRKIGEFLKLITL